MDISVLQGLLIVIAPVLLAAAIAWAIIHNHSSDDDIRRTEEATRELYEAQDLEDRMRDNQ